MQSTTRASVYFICRNALNKRFSQRLHNLSVSRSHAIILWAYCFAWQRIYCNNILAAKYYRFKFACEWKRKNELIWINSQPQKSIWISFFANGFFLLFQWTDYYCQCQFQCIWKLVFGWWKKQATAYWIVWFRWRDANAKYQKSMMRDNKNIHTLIHSERRSTMGERKSTQTHTQDLNELDWKLSINSRDLFAWRSFYSHAALHFSCSRNECYLFASELFCDVERGKN